MFSGRITRLWLSLLLLWSLCPGVVRAQSALPLGSGELGVVFAAHPSGGGELLQHNIRTVVARSGLPLRVVAVMWGHGPGAVPQDVQDQANHHDQGLILARNIMKYRQWNPGGKVYLISHSAGGAVLLAAANYLPPNSVERIILMSPGVSSCYDLRPALRASRQGIDLFYSRMDSQLDLFIQMFGTTEGRGFAAAGLVGFTPVIASPADVQLYRKLRQHPWRLAYDDLHYYGGHFGLVSKTFLSYAVLPMLLTP
jgi:pimeloyl-ACP methyl ester carboxylesterase